MRCSVFKTYYTVTCLFLLFCSLYPRFLYSSTNSAFTVHPLSDVFKFCEEPKNKEEEMFIRQAKEHLLDDYQRSNVLSFVVGGLSITNIIATLDWRERSPQWKTVFVTESSLFFVEKKMSRKPMSLTVRKACLTHQEKLRFCEQLTLLTHYRGFEGPTTAMIKTDRTYIYCMLYKNNRIANRFVVEEPNHDEKMGKEYIVFSEMMDSVLKKFQSSLLVLQQ